MDEIVIKVPARFWNKRHLECLHLVEEDIILPKNHVAYGTTIPKASYANGNQFQTLEWLRSHPEEWEEEE